MRSTMTRLTRVAAAAAIGLTLLVGVNVTAAPAASAADCFLWLCGGVRNTTPHQMHYTTDLSASWRHHRCDVWNWDGGNSRNWKHAYCVQNTTGGGGGGTTVGGPYSGVDVDAFTFVGRGYHVKWGLWGAWSWHVGGEWTKIQTDEMAYCGIGDQNEVWCSIKPTD
jgi:hypothetical protein